MFKVNAVAISDDTIMLDSDYDVKRVGTYLEISKEIAKRGINPIDKKWVFKNKTFSNISEMLMEGLNNGLEKISKLEKDVDTLEVIQELNFDKGYIEIHKEVPTEILINGFRALPTLWHLEIRKGTKTWKNISEFAKEYFGKMSVRQLKEMSKNYIEEGDE